MNIEIKVVTNAKKREIKLEGAGLRVKLIAMPQDGKANDELIDYLAAVFGIRKSKIKILRGEKDRHKLVFLPVDEAALKSVGSEK